MWKCAICNATNKVNAISRSRNISCALVCIDAARFDAIRDPVPGILGDYPEARYCFDISAGSKCLSLGLFSMSLWVVGDTYTRIRKFSDTKSTGSNPSRKNPSGQSAFSRNSYHSLPEQEHGRQTSTLVPQDTLFNEAKNGQIQVNNAKGGSAGQELSRADFSRLIAKLVGWNVIREETIRVIFRKLYSIMPDGELAFGVFGKN